MFITEAVVKIAIEKLENLINCDNSNILNQLKTTLKEIAETLRKYYNTFHSIQWNRSKIAIKEQVELQLSALAQEAYKQLNLAGELINNYTQHKEDHDFKEVNGLVQLLQEAKMLIEIHHLDGKIRIIELIENTKVKNTNYYNCIPGLEEFL